MDLRFLLLLVCFFVSGFAALLYQTAWTREFAFLFGTSELAVVAVLAAYMGGLALGAAAAARYVGRLARPVLAYGVLELGIAFGALAVPFLIRAVQAAYLGFAGGLEAPPETMALTTALFHLVGSFVVLVPCTALMGATLPLLARYAVAEDAQVGPRIGILYAVNTFGAIAGTLTAAFALLPALGLRQTVFVGIAGNAIVFLAAAALAKGIAGLPAESANDPRAGRGAFHWILPAMLISGAVSFLYEVLWTRLLGQVLGGSTAAFASMLASFLLGIALGSAAASRFAKTRSSATIGFAVAQIGAGVLGWFAFRMADRLPELMAQVGATAATPATGAGVAGLVLLPVTLCIGATFPFGVRLLAKDADEAAAVSGRVYAWNTVGSIVGSIGAGFFLLPMLGLEGTARVGVLTSLALAVVTALASTPRRPVLAGIACVAIAALGMLGLPVPREPVAAFGDRRRARLGQSLLPGRRALRDGHRRRIPGRLAHLDQWAARIRGRAARDPRPAIQRNGLALAAADGGAARGPRDAHHRARRGEDPRSDGVDGRVDRRHRARRRGREGESADPARESAARRSARPPAHRGRPRRDESVQEEVRRDRVPALSSLDFRRVPSLHAGFLRTRPFKARSGRDLRAMDRGRIRQRRALREPDGRDVRCLSLRPRLSSGSGGDGLHGLGSADRSARIRPRALAAAPDSFGLHGIHRVEDFYASWSLDSDGVRKLAEGRPVNTDDHNRLATTRLPSADRHMNRDTFDASLAVVDVLTPEHLMAVDSAAVLRRMNWTGESKRARKLARTLPPPLRMTAEAWLMLDDGPLARAQAMFRRALAADPTSKAARAGMIASFIGGELDPSSLSSEEAAVATANDRLQARDWLAISELDTKLAQIQPGDLLFGAATRARVAWRVEGNDPAAGLAAIAIIDRLLTRERTADHYFMRAKAGHLAGDPAIAWAALAQVVNGRPRPYLVKMALELTQALGPEPQDSLVTRQLAQLARARR